MKCAHKHVIVWWENLISHKVHINNADDDDNDNDYKNIKINRNEIKNSFLLFKINCCLANDLYHVHII